MDNKYLNFGQKTPWGGLSVSQWLLLAMAAGFIVNNAMGQKSESSGNQDGRAGPKPPTVSILNAPQPSAQILQPWSAGDSDWLQKPNFESFTIINRIPPVLDRRVDTLVWLDHRLDELMPFEFAQIFPYYDAFHMAQDTAFAAYMKKDSALRSSLAWTEEVFFKAYINEVNRIRARYRDKKSRPDSDSNRNFKSELQRALDAYETTTERANQDYERDRDRAYEKYYLSNPERLLDYYNAVWNTISQRRRAHPKKPMTPGEIIKFIETESQRVR